MKRNKVQINEFGVNVLVETENSNNQHISHLDKIVDIKSVLSDEQVLQLFREKISVKELIEIAKDWIKKQPNYAVSNCVDNSLNINYSSIVKFAYHE